jgi:histidinol dehydrogenase
LNEAALRQVGPAAALLARTEGLTGHAAAVERRL